MSDEKAKPIERNVTLSLGCRECGSKVNYTLWEKNGQTWYGCSNKIGSQYCKGKPPDGAARLDGAPPAPQPNDPEGGSPSAPSGSSADLLDRIADNMGELATLFAELSHIQKGRS